MTRNLNRELFRRMMVEEWRLQTSLFGGKRFALFPVVIALFSAFTVYVTPLIGTPKSLLIGGIHALALLFGLHTGSIGFIGRDAVENMLGDVTLLIYSARTLPVSKQRLLAIFLIKDLVYYSGLFILPLVLGFSVAVGAGWMNPIQLPLLWISLTESFLLGVVTTLCFIGAGTRGIDKKSAGVITAVIGVATVVLLNIPVGRVTPYYLFTNPSVIVFLLYTSLIVLLGGIGTVLFSFESQGSERTAENQLRWISNIIPRTGGELVVKSLLDLSRSSGGLLKPVFSGTILFAVSIGLIHTLEVTIGVTPSKPIALAAMLGLTAFTSYNWVSQFDDLSQYQPYPVSPTAVYKSKLVTFLLTGVPVGIIFYLVSMVLFGYSLMTGFVGLLLVIAVQMYLFGLTIWLAGLKPNEFLFDTVLFSAFTIGVSIVVVPVLLWAILLGARGGSGTTEVLPIIPVIFFTGVMLVRSAAQRASHD